MAKHTGTARFAYNWGLTRRMERLEKNDGKERFTTAMGQHREWNLWKRENAPWWREVSKCAPQEALRDLDRAFKNFWRERKKDRKFGFPKMKRKGIHDSFRLTGAIYTSSGSVTLPRIGEVRTKEPTDVKGKIFSVTVSREADRWFVCLTVERERPEPQSVKGPIVGADLGLNSFAVLSDGTRFQAPKPLEHLLKRFRRLSKRHSRKMKGSNNRRKSARQLARFHRRVRNMRRDFLHKLTTTLAKTKSVVAVETLSVRGMVRNPYLARSISDAGWSDFRRMLSYKTVWYGSHLIVAPRNYPSTRRCSACGHVGPQVPLSERSFECPACGLVFDRDENAAKNLEQLATASSAGSYACGDSSVGGTGSFVPGLRDMGR